MHGHSYKYYLNVLEKKSNFSLFQKTLLFLLAVALTTAGGVTAFSFWQFKKEAPLRAQVNYLESATNGFTASQSSLSEIISGFQVAGAKVKAVDALKEATPTAEGYYISLEDLDKTIATVQSTQKNLLQQKNQLSKLPAPEKFQKISNDLFAYYNQSINLLDNLLTEAKFQREILVASGTNFYLPVLSDESMWKSQNKDQIIRYYEDKKRQAQIALADLPHLDVPPDFQKYYDAQTSYLELLVGVAGDIGKTLAQKDSTEKDSVPQIEKAYQKLQEAKAKNEALSQDLLTQRLKVFDRRRNLGKFAQVNIDKNALAARLSDLNQSQSQPKEYKIPQILINVLDKVGSAKIFTGFTKHG